MPPKRKSTSTTSTSKKQKVKSDSPQPEPQPPVKVEHEVKGFPEQMKFTPLKKLYDTIEKIGRTKFPDGGKKGDGVVVYWMRNKDLRLRDNNALVHASTLAQSHSCPLIVLHILSPSDYVSHDRSPRRIDFQLRALSLLSSELHKSNIPLITIEYEHRKDIPKLLMRQLGEWKARAIVANLEYEVDELRRDDEVLKLAMKGSEGWKGPVILKKDFCVVPPGEILTKQGAPYSVFSPWYRTWSSLVLSDPQEYLYDAGTFEANPASVTSIPLIKKLLAHEVPKEVKGFELDKEERETMEGLWPVGQDVCDQIIDRFLHTKVRPQHFDKPPLAPGASEVAHKDSKIGSYGVGRNRVDWDGTSHISAYLATGMISPRETLRATMKLSKGKLRTDKSDGGVGVWVSEVAWRDFYQHVLAAWPRVCMNRPFNLKYEDIAWEYNSAHLDAWKEGRTGYPIVDAAMRALKKQGYMHNRCRMIVAMFLTKDLMLDWRDGEKWFMQNLVDGDLASNNGGWQWSSSTGTDPQPYFRIFNPINQSEKSDPDGDYIRFWVPELKQIKGKAIHEPWAAFSEKELEKMGYCKRIVDHKFARTRAIARYKNPGDRIDE